MKRIQSILSIVFLCSVFNVTATTFYVSSISGSDANNGDLASSPVASIQTAVDNASSGDEIYIAALEDSSTCTYSGSGSSAVITLPAGKSLKLKGGYIYIRISSTWVDGVVPALVDGDSARRCLFASTADGDTNHIELLEFANGAADLGANIYAEGGSLQLVGTPIHNGTASSDGGGLYMADVDFSVSMGSYSNLSLPQMTGFLPIYSNSAVRGGGLFLDGGYPLLTTIGLMDNTASENGGAIYIDGGVPSVVGGTIQNNIASENGGGIYMTNSIARVGGMLITSNTAVYGGGIYLDGPFALSMEAATLIANNYIRFNDATGGKGGGIFFNEANVGVVNNIIANNIATNGAAGYLKGSSSRFLENTIADNVGDTGLYVTHSSGEGRWVVVHTWFGTYSNYVEGIPVPSQPTLTNSIISGNSTALYVEDSGNSVLPNKVDMGYTIWWENSIADIAGPGTVTHDNDLYTDPLYTSKGMQPTDMTPYHIETNSPAVDSGTSISLSLPGTDLMLDIDGQMRPSGNGMDIGADEVVTDPFSVWFVPIAISSTVKSGTVITNIHTLLNSGTQNDSYTITVADTIWSSTVTPDSVALDAQSSTSVTVVITIPAGALDGDTNTTTITATSQNDANKTAIAIDTTGVSTNAGESTIHYVWLSSPTPQEPYATPDTAGHDIQSVVNICNDGDTVLVYPGTYNTGGKAADGEIITNRVCITNETTVTSISGRDDTIIEGAADPVSTNGPGAMRGVYLTGGAELVGLTVINGHTYTNTDSDAQGGGIYMIDGAIVSNCLITASSSENHGGGIYGRDLVYIINSVITANNSGGYGGGVYLYNWGFIINSQIKNNYAPSYGGGIDLAVVSVAEQCTISSNRADNAGGGINVGENSILTQCYITDNSAPSGGGGRCTSDSKIENSLFTGNQADNTGGALFLTGGSILNSTITDNSANNGGSGIFFYDWAEIINSIVYDNNNDNWDSVEVNTNLYSWNNSCTIPNPGSASGNITNAPLFINAASGDYHIPINSPCTDTGTNIELTTEEDMDGNHRPMDGNADGKSILDMGCYEVSNANGDSDEDSVTDGNEAVADTDPYDANDYFHIKAVSNNTAVTIFFDSSQNRTYTLLGQQDLTDNTWTNIPGNGPRPGNGDNDFMVDTNSATCEFYRIKVEL